jgi:hypothetical protein
MHSVSAGQSAVVAQWWNWQWPSGWQELPRQCRQSASVWQGSEQVRFELLPPHDQAADAPG